MEPLSILDIYHLSEIASRHTLTVLLRRCGFSSLIFLWIPILLASTLKVFIEVFPIHPSQTGASFFFDSDFHGLFSFGSNGALPRMLYLCYLGSWYLQFSFPSNSSALAYIQAILLVPWSPLLSQGSSSGHTVILALLSGASSVSLYL